MQLLRVLSLVISVRTLSVSVVRRRPDSSGGGGEPSDGAIDVVEVVAVMDGRDADAFDGAGVPFVGVEAWGVDGAVDGFVQVDGPVR